jgi:FtsP/CotA-like multicopper oxidase with cupredoxin domain
VYAKDSYPLPQPYLCDTPVIGPGERWDVLVEVTGQGEWAFHCHTRSVTHAASAHGTFGMVTAMIVSA